MNRTIAIAPVRRSVVVKAPPQRAFDVFTRQPATWWPAEHTIAAVPRQDIVIEPQVGGRWFERGVDGSECLWGQVLAWSPPSRLVLAWQIGADWAYHADLITEVEVTFTAVDGGTRVDLEHRHLERFGEAAEQVRGMIDSEGGWRGILARFAAAV